MDKLISVIVPVYNSAKFLRQCIDSIKDQTIREIELICVNDGSTDDSGAILTEYAAKDPRIQVINRINDGKGAAAARNLGLDHATGKYVIFLDGDDFFERDMLQKMVDSAEKNDADLVICRAERYDNRSGKRERDYEGINFRYLPEKQVFTYKDCPDRIFQIADWVVWNKLFRRELLIENCLRFESIPVSDDQYVPALALVLAKRISYVDEVFIHYRVNTGTSQVDRQAEHPEAAYLATYSVVDRMRECGAYEAVKKSYLNNAIRVFREYFDRMAEYEELKDLYNRYRDIEFPRLEAENLSGDFFYDSRLADWYEMIKNRTLEDILLEAARGHGDKMTTAVLRFQVPYTEIRAGSKIVLVGKGRVGRYWYSQIVLSGYCDVAAWVDSKKDIPQGIEYDQVVEAK